MKEKMVLFTREADTSEVQVDEDAWISEPEDRQARPTKPLTVKELRLIRQALQAAAREDL